MSTNTFISFARLPHLTSLDLWSGELRAPFTVAAEAQNLQELSLHAVETSAKYLQDVCFLLPSITQMKLDSCEDLWSDGPEQGAPPNLR